MATIWFPYINLSVIFDISAFCQDTSTSFVINDYPGYSVKMKCLQESMIKLEVRFEYQLTYKRTEISQLEILNQEIEVRNASLISLLWSMLLRLNTSL